MKERMKKRKNEKKFSLELGVGLTVTNELLSTQAQE